MKGKDMEYSIIFESWFGLHNDTHGIVTATSEKEAVLNALKERVRGIQFQRKQIECMNVEIVERILPFDTMGGTLRVKWQLPFEYCGGIDGADFEDVIIFTVTDESLRQFGLK